MYKTIDEVAKSFGVSTDTVRYWIMSGQLRSRWSGLEEAPVVESEYIQDFLNESRRKGQEARKAGTYDLRCPCCGTAFNIIFEGGRHNG